MIDLDSDLSSKTFLITGASSGLGRELARFLDAHGANVIGASRRPGAVGTHIPLDLSNINSIRRCADALRDVSIDCLINNAGVLLPDTGQVHETEAHMGINFLGHFALTHALYPQLKPRARIVQVSSMAAQFVRLTRQRLFQQGQRGFKAYALSKLANLMFAAELAERDPVKTSVACHPGYTATNLQSVVALGPLGNRILGQRVEQGVASLIRAATDPAIRSCDMVGPTGFFHLRGEPVISPIYRSAVSRENRRALWSFAEQKLDLQFDPQAVELSTVRGELCQKF